MSPADLEHGTYDGNVELRTKQGSVGFGHCIVTDLFSVIPQTVIGHCVFSGGTGQLRGFNAEIVVSVDKKDVSLADWDGRYSFARKGGKD